MKLKLIGALGMSVVLAACGGGGGSSSGGGGTNTAGTSGGTETPKDQPAGTQKPTSEQAGWIAGLYDASTASDEIYYEIDAEGVVRTHDYMNDGVDSAGNCYQPAPADSTTKANAILEGKQLYWDAANNQFATKTSAGTVKIGIDATTKEINKLGLGGISGGSGLNLTTSSYILRLTPDTTATPTLADVKAALCS